MRLPALPPGFRRTPPRLWTAMVVVTILIPPVLPAAADTAGPVEAAAETGVIVGKAYDESTGRELGGVLVAVEGTELSARSGVDGSFRLSRVPVGTVAVVFSLEGFQSLKVAGVEVATGGPASLSAPMQPAPNLSLNLEEEDFVEMQEIVIREVSSLPSSAQAFTEMRRNVNVSVDTLSAEELGKFAGSDISEVIIRMPGVSIASQGSFAVIRGLGERYNTTTLNGVALPSSDPERQSVELDQFPSRLLDGLVVYKSAAPHLPSNLTGGGVEVKPLSFPNKRFVSLTVGLELDEGVISGEDFLTYPSEGSHDWFAVGSRGRISTDEVFRFAREQGTPTRLAIDPDFPYAVEREELTPMPKGAFGYGDTFEFRNGLQLGLLLSLSYDASRTTIDGMAGGGVAFRVVADEAGGPELRFEDESDLRDGYDFERSTEKVLMGGYAGVSLRLSDSHQLTLAGLMTRIGTDRAEFQSGIINVDSFPYSLEAIAGGAEPWQTYELFKYRIEYVERNLTNLSLGGAHRFDSLGDAKLTWTASWSSAYRDQPDSRFFLFGRPFNEVQYEVIAAGTDVSAGVNRYWNKVEEEQPALRADLAIPLRLGNARSTLTLGGETSTTTRDYREVQPGTLQFPGGTSVLPFEDPREVSAAAGYAISGTAETSLERELTGLFGQLVVPLTSTVTLSGGLRYDHSTFVPSGFGLVPGGSTSAIMHYLVPENYSKYFDFVPITVVADTEENRALFSPTSDEERWLPSANLAWSPRSNLTLRLSYSETIARASLRELSSYYSFDSDDDLQIGNVFLEQSDVRNLEFRTEWFFEGTDLAAFTVFGKEIDRPIEKFFMSLPNANGVLVESWLNNPDTATLLGFEFEARRNLGALSERLAGLTLGGNATFIDAAVAPFRRVDPLTGTIKYTEKSWDEDERRLYDQPTWLLNLDATYAVDRWGFSATVTYFASDRVLASVATATEGFADQYRDQYDRVDLTVRKRFGERLSLKLTAKNLLDPERRLIRDPDVTGDVIIVDRSWHDGRAYSLTATYDF